MNGSFGVIPAIHYPWGDVVGAVLLLAGLLALTWVLSRGLRR